MVYLVEGEKDADRLASLGLVATCNSGGAKKWRAEFADALKGRHVAIIPDQDGPGRKHASAVAASLTGKAASVRLVTLADLRSDGAGEAHKDVSDWLDAGYNVEQLQAITKRGEPLGQNASPPRVIEFVDSATFAAAEYQTQWLVPEVLTRGEPGQIVGPMKACKTTVAVDLCLSIATATPFLGHFAVPNAARCGLVSGESGRATLQETAHRIAPI